MGISTSEPLGKYFTVGQFIRSTVIQGAGTNNMLGVDGGKYGSPSQCLQYAKDLFENCVDPIVEKWGNMKQNSGYRCRKGNDEDLPNAGYAASKNSQHKYAQAIDISVPSVPTQEIFNWCIKNIPYDQIIWEFPERGRGSWVHISYKSNANKFKRTIATKRQDYHDNYSTLDTTFSSTGTYQHYIDTARFTSDRVPLSTTSLEIIPVTSTGVVLPPPTLQISGNSAADFYDEI
tara:strand:- start:2563 stop:3261 length:699 start_codon:yes stop_codon:yes gene_type:complete